MAVSVLGGCRCRAVRYEVRKTPVFSIVCHCNACLRRFGPYVGGMFVRRDGFESLGTTLVFDDIGGSGHPIAIHSCEACFTQVFAHAAVLPSVAFVLASTFDDSQQFQPLFHNWVSAKPHWVSIDDDLPQMLEDVDWSQIGGRPDFGGQGAVDLHL